MYEGKSILELHELLVAKKVTPLEPVKESIESAKTDNNNAFEYIAEQEALDFAATLVEPEEDNLLWGIPFVAKDNMSTKEYRDYVLEQLRVLDNISFRPMMGEYLIYYNN
mgnify:CR=1 FL=1